MIATLRVSYGSFASLWATILGDYHLEKHTTTTLRLPHGSVLSGVTNELQCLAPECVKCGSHAGSDVCPVAADDDVAMMFKASLPADLPGDDRAPASGSPAPLISAQLP